jgi:energy-coupling factor transport system ATP-binding protein
LEGVRCRLGGRLVLELDRVEFPRGQVTAIRGPNGAGTPTRARIVAGLQAAAGTVRLDGRPLRAAARRRAAAIVMQDVQRQLFTDSVAAELRLAAGRSRDARHEDLLAALDLDHLADRHPLALSGGQQQRLVVAAGRFADRPVVVFDEPSSGVDRRHLGSVSDQLRGLAADGAVVLLISHDEDLLARAADAQLALAPLD